MTLLQFIQLPEKLRAIEAFERGIVLETERIYEETYVLLYMNNFFIEITFNPENGIVDIIPFKTGYRLEKYIDKVCIDKLM